MIVPAEHAYGEKGLPRFGIDSNVDLEYFFQILPQDQTHSLEPVRPRGYNNRDIRETKRREGDIEEEEEETHTISKTMTDEEKKQTEQNEINHAISEWLNDGKPKRQKDPKDYVRFSVNEAEGSRDVAKNIRVKTTTEKQDPVLQNRYGIKVSLGEKPKKEGMVRKSISAYAGMGGTQEV